MGRNQAKDCRSTRVIRLCTSFASLILFTIVLLFPLLRTWRFLLRHDMFDHATLLFRGFACALSPCTRLAPNASSSSVFTLTGTLSHTNVIESSMILVHPRITPTSISTRGTNCCTYDHAFRSDCQIKYAVTCSDSTRTRRADSVR